MVGGSGGDVVNVFEQIDALFEEAGRTLRFWQCPEGHSMGGKLEPTVEWEGDVATCLRCGKTSADPPTDVVE